MKNVKMQVYGVSTSIISIISQKCNLCKTSPSNIQIYSTFKRNFPSTESKINSSLKLSFFKFKNGNDKHKTYATYKIKNITIGDELEFTDVFSCKCGKLSLLYNHTEGLQKKNSINRARRSKKSFSKKMSLSSFF